MPGTIEENDALDILAGEYVIGTLEGAERLAFETRLARDPGAARAVARWQERFGALEESAEDTPPPPNVWAGIKAEISRDGAAEAEFLTIHAEQGAWEEISPGIHRKDLNEDPETKAVSFLLRFDPQTAGDSHFHRSDEELLMLSGDLSIGSTKLRAGDYHLARKDSTHPDVYSAEGAVFFVRAII
jgi:hypothetical protein